MHKILLIDDNDSLRKTVSYFLSKKGYSVQIARDGEEALEELKRFVPDVIVCDLKMPKMNGTTFIKKLQASEDFSEIPVIVITAVTGVMGGLEIDNKKLQVIQKPFSLMQLNNMIADTLS